MWFPARSMNDATCGQRKCAEFQILEPGQYQRAPKLLTRLCLKDQLVVLRNYTAKH